MRRFGPALVGLLGLVAALALWQGLVAVGLLSRFAAPPPSSIAASFPDLLASEGLLGAFVETFLQTFIAAVLAILVGVPFGWWLHRNHVAGLAYESWAAGLAAAPLVMLYPLFLVLIGRNAETIVVMGLLSALPPVVLKTKEALDGVRQVLLDVARSFGLGPARQFWMIMLPAAAPVIGNGVRLGLIFALINVVGVEFLINYGGLGATISALGDRFELPKMFGAICFVVLTSICFFMLTERLERWLQRR